MPRIEDVVSQIILYTRCRAPASSFDFELCMHHLDLGLFKVVLLFVWNRATHFSMVVGRRSRYQCEGRVTLVGQSYNSI